MLGLYPQSRAQLHQRIAARFQQMMTLGFLQEVQKLYDRGDLTLDHPAVRAVGYRQAWSYLNGTLAADEWQEKAIIATRQLAKRQLTWQRHWSNLIALQAEDADLEQQVISRIHAFNALNNTIK